MRRPARLEIAVKARVNELCGSSLLRGGGLRALRSFLSRAVCVAWCVGVCVSSVCRFTTIPVNTLLLYSFADANSCKNTQRQDNRNDCEGRQNNRIRTRTSHDGHGTIQTKHPHAREGTLCNQRTGTWLLFVTLFNAESPLLANTVLSARHGHDAVRFAVDQCAQVQLRSALR